MRTRQRVRERRPAPVSPGTVRLATVPRRETPVVIPHFTPPPGIVPALCARRRVLVVLLSAWLCAACSQQTTYPPALPQAPTGADIPWGSDLTPKRPPSSSERGKPVPPTSVVPPEEEWSTYRPYVPPQTACKGKGQRRRCKLVQPSVIDRANQGAFVKATSVHTMHGQSVLVRYPLVLGGLKVYHIETSPQEFTRLLLPPGEHLAAKLRLHPNRRRGRDASGSDQYPSE